MTLINQTSYINTVLYNAGFAFNADPNVLNLGNGYVYTKSVFKSKSILVGGSGFSDDGTSAYVNALQAGPLNAYFIFDLFGGSKSAINKNTVKSGDGWIHRNSLFDIQMFVYLLEQPQVASSEIAFINRIWNAYNHPKAK